MKGKSGVPKGLDFRSYTKEELIKLLGKANYDKMTAQLATKGLKPEDMKYPSK